MTYQEALVIVLDLASQNVVELYEDADEHQRQWEAITVVFNRSQEDKDQ